MPVQTDKPFSLTNKKSQLALDWLKTLKLSPFNNRKSENENNIVCTDFI